MTTVSIGVPNIKTEPRGIEHPPIIFYPASTYPHKNHITLIKAFIQLSGVDPDVRLVLIGAPGKAELKVRRAIEKSGLAERISFLGRVTLEEKKEIFESASILAFPSEYEGFGIPVLESMSAGIPVVASRGTPAAKLLGNKALTVNAYDVEGWVVALSKLLNDNDLRNRLVLEGFKQAREYTYQKSAQQLLETWRKLITIRQK